jgi:hypothetical protein
MKPTTLLLVAGFLMAIFSLTALSTDTVRAIDTQCVKRCRCDAGPCGSIVQCRTGMGEWTNCCDWCSH